MKRTIFTLLLLPLGGTVPISEDFITTVSASAAATILTPAVHPDQNLSHVDNLKIGTSALLYYRQDSSGDGSQAQDASRVSSKDTPIATINIPKLKYPIVQLENSQYIATLVCSVSQATIKFSDSNAFRTALADWRQKNEFVIITYDPSCGDGYEKNERNFILVTNVSADKISLTITAKITHLNIAEAVGGDNIVHVKVGSYTPNSRDGYPTNMAEHTSGANKPSDDQASKRSTAYSKDYSKSLNLNSFPTNAQSPWGSAYSIYKNDIVSAYCVGCGISGQITIKGSFSLTFAHGLTVGNIDLAGTLHGGLELGLVANTISKTINLPEISLIDLPLSPLSIAGVVTLGPNLALHAGGALTVAASGNLLAGANLDWSAITATLDLSHPSESTASGFSPQLSPVFQAKGNISATANAYLAVRLGCGIDILNGKFSKEIALVEKPGVSITAKAAGQLGGGPPSTASCNVDLSAYLTNDVSVDLAGIKQVDISSWKSGVLEKCVA